jgi:predicted transposase/invertase (TIGR01784 family)
MEIQNVHDKFFKETFSRVDVATNFLEEFLPADFIQKLELSSLTIDNASYINENLEEHFADILYTCNYGDKGKIKLAFLYEHKSYKDDYPHWQLIQYMVNVWQGGVKQKKEKPMIVIPIVIYHGKRKWDYQPMKSYFENLDENLLKFIPEFEYYLVDLGKVPDQQITSFKNKFLSISALLFKYNRYKKYVKRIESELVSLMKLIDNQENNPFSIAVILYIQNTDGLTITEIISIFTKVSVNLNNVVMTTAQQLVNQGMEIKEIITIKKGLQLGFNNETIAALVDESVQKVEEIIAKIKLGLL